MFDMARAIEDVKMEALVNGLEIILNTEAVTTDPDIEERYLRRVIEKALNAAYGKRRGMNLETSYPFSRFLNEADRYYDVIVNMAYTALTRRGSEGQTSHSENGVSRQYTSSGLYLLSDLALIPEVAGI